MFKTVIKTVFTDEWVTDIWGTSQPIWSFENDMSLHDIFCAFNYAESFI